MKKLFILFLVIVAICFFAKKEFVIENNVEVVQQTPHEFLRSEMTAQGFSDRDYYIMVHIIGCESAWSHIGHQGEPRVYMGNVGLAQINIHAHEDRYRKLGLDVYNDPFDNIRFALILYKEQGIQPWYAWSGHCFEKRLIENQGIRL